MASKSAIVLTVPHAGTHFAMHLVCNVLGVKAEYGHFSGSGTPSQATIKVRLEQFDPDKELLILPWRPEFEIKATWLKRTEGPVPREETMKRYKECWDARDHLTPLMTDIGFEILPIPKSPLRFQAFMRLADKLDVEDGDLQGCYQFVEDWPVMAGWDAKENKEIENAYYKQKSMDKLMHDTVLKEKRDA